MLVVLIGIRFSSVAGGRPTNPLRSGVSERWMYHRGAELQMPGDSGNLRPRREVVFARSRSLAAFAWGTLRDSSMRQTRNLKYCKDFKLRLPQLLQRGGLTCRNTLVLQHFLRQAVHQI